MIETTIHNDFAMFSEKEANLLSPKDLSNVWSLRDQLKAFRSLGFKTFDCVIDESYDLIEDKHERWHKALDSMLELTERESYRSSCNELERCWHITKIILRTVQWKRCLTWDSYQ